MNRPDFEHWDEERERIKARNRAAVLGARLGRAIVVPDNREPHWIHEPMRFADDGSFVVVRAANGKEN